MKNMARKVPPAAKIYSISFVYFAKSRRGRGYAGFSSLGGLNLKKTPLAMIKRTVMTPAVMRTAPPIPSLVMNPLGVSR